MGVPKNPFSGCLSLCSKDRLSIDRKWNRKLSYERHILQTCIIIACPMKNTCLFSDANISSFKIFNSFFLKISLDIYSSRFNLRQGKFCKTLAVKIHTTFVFSWHILYYHNVVYIIIKKKLLKHWQNLKEIKWIWLD